MVKPPELRTYNKENCITFRKTSEKFGGLSNMAGGYPLLVNGVKIWTSEALYQACRFPHLTEVQQLIIAEKSPMTAKMKSKPYRNNSRSDWDLVRIKIMRWCLQIKLIQNWDKFSSLLLETRDLPIVEDSKKDDFWGAKLQDEVTLTGANVLGRLLMQLREQIKNEEIKPTTLIKPLNISSFLLYNQQIYPVCVNCKIYSENENYIYNNNYTSTFVEHVLDLNGLNGSFNLNNEQDFKSNCIKQSITSESNITEYNAFNIMLPYIEKALINERTDKELAQIFDIPIKLMRNWLKRAVLLGKVKKLSKPVRYVLEHQLHLDI